MVDVPGGVNATNQPIFGRLSRQVPDYLLGKLREIRDEAIERADSWQSMSDVFSWVEHCREKALEVLGPFPSRTPLNAQSRGTLVRAGYNIEKVLFESMPRWFVSGCLYIPTSLPTPAPGILVLCGHDDEGKFAYQNLSSSLAKLGYVALCIDTHGMSERKELVPGNPGYGSPGYEHKQLGKILQMLGWSVSGLQAWDASRAIDYLFGRPEVNISHIGVCGTSGGGTVTILVSAIDRRITMSAANCSFGTFEQNFATELWQDHEQIPVKALRHKLDMADFMLCMFPNPILVSGQQRDYFPVDGLIDGHAYMSEAYAVSGILPDYCQIFIDTNDHILDKDGRQAFYRFFNEFTGGTRTVIEPPLTLEPNESDLWVTPTGSVFSEPGAKRSQVWLAEMADALIVSRGSPRGDELKSRIREAFSINEANRVEPPNARIWECFSGWTRPIASLFPSIPPPNYPTSYGCVYALETGIVAPLYYLSTVAWHSPPPKVANGTRAILYVAHNSSDRELSRNEREALINTLRTAEPNAAFFALDVGGTGESNIEWNGAYPEDASAQMAECLGQSMLGGALWDVLRAIDWLAKYGYTDIHLAGRAYGAIPAALAAVLDTRVTKVTLKNSLTRWDICVRGGLNGYSWPGKRLPAGVLCKLDLPDVYAELGSKLVQETPWGAKFAAGPF